MEDAFAIYACVQNMRTKIIIVMSLQAKNSVSFRSTKDFSVASSNCRTSRTGYPKIIEMDEKSGEFKKKEKRDLSK